MDFSGGGVLDSKRFQLVASRVLVEGLASEEGAAAGKTDWRNND